MNPFNADQLLQAVVSHYIEKLRKEYSRGKIREQWVPGKSLKLLLAGYNGARNTGADVRVAEMVRQFQAILGPGQAEITVMSVNPELSEGYFPGARQVRLPQLFPRFLYEECPKHHGVVACEGSMFKSKWADALTTMMAGALGMAAAENKLSVGYGAEAGDMTPYTREFVRRHCRNSLVICRNEPSRRVLSELGIRNSGGTDTAWTFEPAPAEVGRSILQRFGWDGRQEILVVCPINPFWWPVRPSLLKFVARYLLGLYRDVHYGTVYFHTYTQQDRAKYRAYLNALAKAIQFFRNEYRGWVILVGMERLDRRACEDLATLVEPSAPVFVSDEYNMYELVSILRQCTYMISSRFHAIVTSMPAKVVSAGVTMDERIRNLLHDRGHQELLLEVDDPQLAEKLIDVTRTLVRDQDRIREEIGRCLPRQYRLMGEMGMEFADEVKRVYPEFPLLERPRRWDAYLPPLSASVEALLEQYA